MKQPLPCLSIEKQESIKFSEQEIAFILQATRETDFNNKKSLKNKINRLLNNSRLSSYTSSINQPLILSVEALDAALILVDIEWVLITFIPMSVTLAAVSMGITLLLSFAAMGVMYLLLRKNHESKNKERQFNLALSKIQSKIAFENLSDTQKKEHHDEFEHDQEMQSTLATQRISSSLFRFDKHIIPSAILTSGLILTLAWALPDFLAALSVPALSIATFTPIGFAVFGVIALLLTARLISKFQQRYQAKDSYSDHLAHLQSCTKKHLLWSSGLAGNLSKNLIASELINTPPSLIP